MDKSKSVVMYINQFFGGIGGEEMADYPPALVEGPAGPALSLNNQLKKGSVTHTIICGDGYMNEHTQEALVQIRDLLQNVEFDVLVAGPAFMSGRYGVACAEVCNFVGTQLGKTAVTCMYAENPGKDMYPRSMYIVEGSNSAARMREDMKKVSSFTDKLLGGNPILWAEKEGYFPRGIRRQIVVEKTAAERAVEMLYKRLMGEPYVSELRIDEQEKVPISPARDPAASRLAFVSTGGLVPLGNPDRIPAASSTHYGKYDISRLNQLQVGQWESVHGGYDVSIPWADPELVMPMDALRRLENEGAIGYLHPWFYSLTGNQTTKASSIRLANQLIDELKRDRIQMVVVGSC